ncbi:voltage-dependent T-type calcium channel subunit alpha-1I-like [Mugil cephalus]|uniref:voltage-dependent T-type calcium channel subunit alpha-1I-like n=1 Tax=Mugil cephalus TaxID=48193 RepID=UPI001FB6F591|nr:voltage-dependent T-type calcium channel subunit alpha-1I-like [Mugil cephalus]
MSLIVAVISCVNQSMYNPLGETNSKLEILDYLGFAYFLVEGLIKMVAFGVCGHNGSYLSSKWNKMDVLVISVEVLYYLLRVFRIDAKICQAFKPLRVMTRFPKMQDLLSLLLDTVPMVTNVLVTYAFVILVFAVIGVQLWAGQLRNRCFLGEDIAARYNVSLSPYFDSGKTPFVCSLDDYNGRRRCHDVPPYHDDGKTCSLAPPHHGANQSSLPVSEAHDCVNWNLYYNVCRTASHNPGRGVVNFDNVGYASITIFQVVTLEGWTEIMYFVIDSHSFLSFVYFILVTIMGSFIIMNVCAVVISTYFLDSMTSNTGEDHSVADTCKSYCYNFLQCFCSIFPKFTRQRQNHSQLTRACIQLKMHLKKIVVSRLFHVFITVVVLMDVISLATEHHNQSAKLTRILIICQRIFFFIFVLEILLKLLVMSQWYFAFNQNLIDFVIVISSVCGAASNDGSLSVLRALRILRLGKLLTFLPNLKRQLLILKRAVAQANTLCWLLLMVIFIFRHVHT